MKTGKQRLLVVGKRIKLKGEDRTMQPCGPAAAIVFARTPYEEIRHLYSGRVNNTSPTGLWLYGACTRVEWLTKDTVTD